MVCMVYGVSEWWAVHMRVCEERGWVRELCELVGKNPPQQP